MRPRADEVLTNVVETFDQYVLPDVTDPYAKSMATVISGLLRQVNLRLEHEGQALFDDVREARAALGGVVELLGSTRASVALPDAAALEAAVRAALAKVHRTDGEYPSLRSLADESAELTGVLDRCNRALMAAEPELGDDELYRVARQRIRAFAAAQLARESAWGFATVIDPGL